MEDNQGAIAITKKPITHARTKHADICHHCIRKAVQDGMVNLHYFPTDKMIADLLTKPLYRERFKILREVMDMIELSSTQPVYEMGVLHHDII